MLPTGLWTDDASLGLRCILVTPLRDFGFLDRNRTPAVMLSPPGAVQNTHRTGRPDCHRRVPYRHLFR